MGHFFCANTDVSQRINLFLAPSKLAYSETFGRSWGILKFRFFSLVLEARNLALTIICVSVPEFTTTNPNENNPQFTKQHQRFGFTNQN